MKPSDEQVIAWAREASKGMLSYDAEGEWRLSQKEVEVAVALAYEAGRKDENKACAKYVDHILKEGGGTWGDAIRARREQWLTNNQKH